ncbi:MAG: outer membrane lipoprotein-sorting protein [Fibrobacterota bacterium]
MRLRLILLFLLTVVCFSLAQTAQEVVARADSLFRGETNRTELTMRIVRPNWTRELSIRSYSMGDEYAMIYILAPARDRGTAFLKRGEEVWQWVPRIQRVIKIPPSMMMQSWMGSDFTNDDLVREASVVTDYDHSFLSDTTIEGQPAWKIQMVPKPRAPVVWEKVITYITKDNFIQRRAEFYGENGELVNVMLLGDVKDLGGRTIPTRIEMIPQEEQGQKTVMIYESIEFNMDLDRSFFSQQNMKRIQ